MKSKYLVSTVVVLLVVVIFVFTFRWKLKTYAVDIYQLLEEPNIEWVNTNPINEGLYKNRLEKLKNTLASKKTESFLVVRGNKIVYEWYSMGGGPNVKHYTAAMAKPLLGVSSLLIALTDEKVGLLDPIDKFVQQLSNDPIRKKVRISDLAFHTSGLEDVDFSEGKYGLLTGWKKDYYEHRGKRFRYAVFNVPFLFEPGVREKYSGVGYYALAYVITKALQDGAHQDNIKSLLKERIMRPLQIPDADWSISYNEDHDVDGMKMYAFGSGAELTTRATARIAQLILSRGHWQGRTIIDPEWIDKVLARDSENKQLISYDHGWFLNIDRKWSSLPKDAIVGIGGGHQVTLIVPSLDLVMVRYGDALSNKHDTFFTVLDGLVFRPLMSAIAENSVGE